MLISWNLQEKSSVVSINTSSTLASRSFIGQATKDTTVKMVYWSIGYFFFKKKPMRHCYVAVYLFY